MSDTPSSTSPQENKTSSPQNQNRNEAQPSLNMDAFARVPLVDTINLTTTLQNFYLDQEVVYPIEVSIGEINAGPESSSPNATSATVAPSALVHLSEAPTLAPTPVSFTYAELIRYLAANGRARPRVIIVRPSEDDAIGIQESDMVGNPEAPSQVDNVDGA